VSEAQALQLSDSGKEMAIKKNADLKRAQEYQAALEAMGMIIRLETMDGAPVDAASPPPSLTKSKESSGKGKRRCPKCNSTHIVDDECQECGVVVSRYKGPPAPPPPKADNPYAAPSAGLYEEAEEGEMTGPVTVPAGHGLKWITQGFWHFRQNMGAWIGALIVWIILSMVLSLIPFLGSLALMIISPAITAGFMLGCQEQDGGGDFEFRHLFAGFSANGGQLALVGLLYLVGMILIIGIVMGTMMGGLLGSMSGAAMGMQGSGMEQPDMGAMMGGMILAVLVMMALFIPLIMAYWFAPALVALEDMSAIAAMRASFKACLKNLLPFLLYGIVAFVLMIIAAIPLALGFLILLPVLIASIYVSYRDIFYGPTRFD
jgi:uncharacterized membrane protein